MTLAAGLAVLTIGTTGTLEHLELPLVVAERSD